MGRDVDVTMWLCKANVDERFRVACADTNDRKVCTVIVCAAVFLSRASARQHALKQRRHLRQLTSRIIRYPKRLELFPSRSIEKVLGLMFQRAMMERSTRDGTPTVEFAIRPVISRFQCICTESGIRLGVSRILPLEAIARASLHHGTLKHQAKHFFYAAGWKNSSHFGMSCYSNSSTDTNDATA